MTTSASKEDPRSYMPDIWIPCPKCARFNACPCGCGWGYCDSEPLEQYKAEKKGCYKSDGARPW